MNLSLGWVLPFSIKQIIFKVSIVFLFSIFIIPNQFSLYSFSIWKGSCKTKLGSSFLPFSMRYIILKLSFITYFSFFTFSISISLIVFYLSLKPISIFADQLSEAFYCIFISSCIQYRSILQLICSFPMYFSILSSLQIYLPLSFIF